MAVKPSGRSSRATRRVTYKLGRRDPCSKKVFSNEQVLKHLADFRASKQSQAAFERDKKLPEGFICKHLAHEARLRDADPAGLSAKTTPYPQLEAAVRKWISDRLKLRGCRLSTSVIRKKAKQLAKDQGIQGFAGSRGWYDGFRHRSGLVSTLLHGERMSADDAAASAFNSKLKLMRAQLGISPGRLASADESLLFPHVYTRRTVTLEALKRTIRGSKQDLTRLGCALPASEYNECDTAL
eukprot:TRINITY_DN1210_c0_g1_i9.p2 TRINITY_DN1210_c0_g1~~TRINITY_DN1210_c0_g1_i9.p2  ORF type:complete len:240 (+),score=11.13 TRINITY_DN1210_c0_g1_i9:129-848(+)